MTSTRTAPTATLESLLAESDREPAELAAALRAAREARELDPATTRHLERLELGFLESRARDRRMPESVRAAVARARAAALEARSRSLEATPDDVPAALFDLAELRAELLADGRATEAARIGAELERRVAAIDALDDLLRFEAAERYASLVTAQEDLALDREILLLRETRDLIEALGRRTRDAELRRLARRLDHAVCDRVLQRRLERTLTRRGAAALENTSLALLFVIFGLLAIDLLFVDRSTGARSELATSLIVIDASICAFFIGEFLFKLALAPRRGSWFVRNALTDLLPAIPAAMWFVADVGRVAEGTAVLRATRLIRVVQFARYVQALRPLLAVFRLVLFLIRGMDSLVRRFSNLLNRNLVFFERVVLPTGRSPEPDDRTPAFQALRREHLLLGELGIAEQAPILVERAHDLAERFRADPPVPLERSAAVYVGVARDVPVEHTIETLWQIEPEQLHTLLPDSDIASLDRLARVVNAPVVRSLPVFRRLRSPCRFTTPEERVVDLGRRIALVLERWRERVLHVADMHGIVTGPQVLDRVASALVNASKRPAVRLLLFGGLFTIVRLVVGSESAIGAFLAKFVATPLVVLGAICLIVFALGKWMKSLAGEAADRFKLTSEAHFIGLLELVKQRYQDEDLHFLARRVFRWDMEPWRAAALLEQQVRAARTGIRTAGVGADAAGVRDDVQRVGLLYLHFLDGAPLHENDIKTTEQLLANLSLENVRNGHIGCSRHDRRRLKKLSPLEVSLFGGPWVWFRFITESVAVETAKRVTDYNRHCLTVEQCAVATREQRVAFARWLQRRRARAGSRLEKTEAPGSNGVYHTTEFNALDFLTVDPQREAHIERVFGRQVLRILRRDRERMIREIFGTRPLHRLPRARRTLNVYAFWQAKLSRGRVFLVPFYAAGFGLRALRMTVQRVLQGIREILAPELAAQAMEQGRAPFAVALRKIHRMKGPTLLEAIRTRVQFDPAYSGAPAGWSCGTGFEPPQATELERDMDFLLMRERDREELRDVARQNRERVQELHALLKRRPDLVPDLPTAEDRRRGERAVTIAYMTDCHLLRTLFRAEAWFEETLQRMEDPATRLPLAVGRRFLARLVRRGPHPMRTFLGERVAHRRVSRRGRRNFVRAWLVDPELRRTVRAWLALPAGASPFDHAIVRARAVHAMRAETSRDLAAVRAVQSLSVLDVRNYRRLIFDLGNYAAEGEDRTLAEALP